MWSVRTPTQDVDMKDVNVLSVIFDVSFRSGEAGRKCAVSQHCSLRCIFNWKSRASPFANDALHVHRTRRQQLNQMDRSDKEWKWRTRRRTKSFFFLYPRPSVHHGPNRSLFSQPMETVDKLLADARTIARTFCDHRPSDAMTTGSRLSLSLPADFTFQ